jgi:membrane-associated protein
MPDLISIIQKIGHLGLFLVILFECGLPAAFFLPGDSLLFSTGLLASQGYLDIKALIPLLFLGGVIGYFINYSLGRYLGERLFNNPNSFWFRPQYVEKARKFFEKYGSKTIFFGRFVPIVRSFAPTVAGAVGMNYKKFAIYNIVGGIVWAIGVTLLGYFLGSQIPSVDKYLFPIILGIIILSLIPAAYEYFRDRSGK